MSGVRDFNQAVEAFHRGDFDSARAAAESALQSSASPRWQHLLGLIHCRRGHPAAGVQHLRAASEAEPENVAYRVMLARALLDCGRAGEALEIAAAPSGTTPPELALWHARAEAADAVGDSVASVEAWERLCSAGIGDWRMWSRYGSALGASAQWLKASRALRRAVELNPSEVPLRRELATALARAGRYDESAEELRHWVDAVDDDAETRILFARLLADLGQSEESAEQLRKAAQIATGDPNIDENGEGLIAIALTTRKGGVTSPADRVNVSVLRELAQLLERTGRLEAVHRLIEDAEALGISREQVGYGAAAVALRQGNASEARQLLLAQAPASDPVRWHWLMARIADALGDPAEAFAEAEAMNRSVQDYEVWRRRAEPTIAAIRSLGETITPDWVSRLQPLSEGEARRLAFLVGFPRSGTTLLDTFLMGHPHTYVLEEIPVLQEAWKMLRDLATLPERTVPEFQRARESYLQELDGRAGADFGGLIIDKLPLNLLAAPILYCLFPDAPFVFAQRHPCDCVLSCFMQGFALNDSMACFLEIATAAQFYDAVMEFWTRTRELLPLKVHTLIYEELVIDPESALRPLIGFLGLEWNGELLDHRTTGRARLAVATPSYNQVTQPLSRAPSGRWKKYKKQLEPVLPILLPWAERLGYTNG